MVQPDFLSFQDVRTACEDMDIIMSGTLTRLAMLLTPVPQDFLLRDFGLFECVDTGMTLHVPGGNLVFEDDKLVFQITELTNDPKHPLGFSLIVRAASTEEYDAWKGALNRVMKNCTPENGLVNKNLLLGRGANATVVGGVILHKTQNGFFEQQTAVKAIRRADRPIPALVETHVARLLVSQNMCSTSIVNYIKVHHSVNEAQIVMERLGPSLEDHVNANGTLSEKQAQEVAVQVISALEYLQMVDIVHGGVSAANVLMERNSGYMKVKLGGLGSASVRCRNWLPVRSRSEWEATRREDGIVHLAPEILFGNAVSFQGDFWSLGVMLYRLMLGRLPFDSDDPIEQMRQYSKITRSDLRRQCLFDISTHSGANPADDLSDDAKSLLTQLLAPEPYSRTTLRSALRHPWLIFARDKQGRHGSWSPVDVASHSGSL